MSAGQSPQRPQRPDWTIDQGWADYTAEEHAVWKTLFERQSALLPGRACDAFVDGMQKLPIRIVPHVNAFAGRGEVAKGATRAIAGWVLHLRGVGAPVDDKASVELVKQANAGDLVAAVQAVLDYLLVDDALVAESVLAQAEEMLGMRP